jgi:DNA-binding transcriptional MerR regulator
MAAKVSKVYRASEVCDLAQVQPYVLRSWEKEFPGIGVQKSPDSHKLYRQSDLDQVLRIKQLVFGEGLTLSGARRRLEEMQPAIEADADDDVAEVLDALASDARTRIAHVRDGLRAILKVLSSAPGTVVVVDDFRLTAVPEPTRPSSAALAGAAAGKKTGKAPGNGKSRRVSA